MSYFVIPMGTKYRTEAVRPVQDAADSTQLAMTMFYHADYGWNGISALHPKWLDRVFVRRVKETPGAVTWLPMSYFS